jgi:hypothetical protein
MALLRSDSNVPRRFGVTINISRAFSTVCDFFKTKNDHEKFRNFHAVHDERSETFALITFTLRKRNLSLTYT